MKHRTTQSALLVAGAAVGVAALAWAGKRRYIVAAAPNTALQQDTLPSQEDAQTFMKRRPTPSELDRERPQFDHISLDEIWDAAPRIEGGEHADPRGAEAIDDPNDVQEDDLDLASIEQ